jgi:hypothetical protein
MGQVEITQALLTPVHIDPIVEQNTIPNACTSTPYSTSPSNADGQVIRTNLNGKQFAEPVV